MSDSPRLTPRLDAARREIAAMRANRPTIDPLDVALDPLDDEQVDAWFIEAATLLQLTDNPLHSSWRLGNRLALDGAPEAAAWLALHRWLAADRETR